MQRQPLFWSLLSALTLLLLVITVAPTVVSGKRLIVQLSVPPLVKHPEYAQLRQQQHHNAAIDALFLLFKEHVRSQQDAFLASLPKHWQVALLKTEKGMMPARVHRLLNAITIRVPDAEAKYAMRIIRLLPGVVAVTEDHRYKLLLHSSRSAIGAFDAWRDLNSTELNAGAGVKVAVMDSGIYTKNAMFSDTGMAYPADGSNISYPQGEASNCNKKVIVSRMYIDPDNLPVSSDRHSYPSLLSSTHGTHCASTVGGALTATSNAGVKLNITGVAPGAWLMNYRIFFRDNSGNTVATSDSQILQAFDDIVADGADVASNSWGSFPFYSSGTPIDIAVRALTDAGVFVVFAAGNDGPTTLTIERYSPALRVGATSSGGRLGSSVMKTTPPLGINVEFLNSGATARSPSGTYTLHAPEDGNELGCSPFKSSFNASENVAVVVLRGTCTFVDKIKNVADAGAKLAIVGNSREGGPELVNMAVTGATINAVSVGHEPALMLINLTKKEAAPSVTLETLSTKTVVSYEADILADFSSRGPTADMQLAPDVCAPGVKIYAAGYGSTGDPRTGYGEVSGTSMACPHAAGASALVLARHPEFTPSEVRSALMSTANYINVLDFDGTPGQPLEIGAGRIDLARAMDPALYLEPQSLSFSLVSMDAPAGSVKKTFTVTSYVNESMTLAVRAVHHTGKGTIGNAPSWVRVEPSTLTISADSGPVNVTVFVDAANGVVGDEQGFVLIEDSISGVEVAHIPYWARVTFKEKDRVDVYVIDVDLSSCDLGEEATDYLPKYTSALSSAGLSYKVWELCDENTDPMPTEILALKSRTVLLFTGDFTVDLSGRDGEIREIMHSGVPVFQMGAEVGYSWGLDDSEYTGESPNIKNEFSGIFAIGFSTIKKVKAAKDAPPAFSSVSSSANCVTRPLIGDTGNKVFLMRDKDDNNVIQAYRYVPELFDKKDEEGSFNSFGILSTIGLECIQDTSAQSKLLKAFYDYSTETIGSYTLSYEEAEPYYTVTVSYSKEISSIKVGWGDEKVTMIDIKEGKSGSITHGYQKMGIYTPRVVVGTIFGGYFELDTKGKQFVVLKDHPEVSAAGVVKASSRLIVTFALLVIFFLVL